MEVIDLWEFDVWKYSESELISFIDHMFTKAGFFNSLPIVKEDFEYFLRAVKTNYLNNPYHNIRHATDVLQFIYKIDLEKAFDNRLDEWDKFSLYLAAFTHDVAHPGKNSEFQKEFHTELYLRFGETSTLEHYHKEVMQNLVNDPEIHLFQNILKAKQKEMLGNINKWILATDMMHHDSIIKKAEKKELKTPHKYAIIALKSADLVQLVRPVQVTEKWIRAFHKEEYLQREEEKKMRKDDGLSDEEFTENQSKELHTFVKKYAYSLYCVLGEIFPELSYLKDQLHDPYEGAYP